ncbi:spore germination protein GerPE [Bacillus sp. UNC438CL73TsuS30]|uniref:spore germination protein GerPE n=1 Tax=Bacillus sp. UNC438CL73TsuS30 TaxID=1340434 RepID=UPI00047EC50B|nr:spore germination protein GerPE [Bacillus sp. UNC438CL73TsuS30]
MLQRTSNVDQLNVMVLSYSSIIQLGDSCIVNGFSRAIAVQREAERFYGNEGNFSTYTVFKKTIPLPPINEAISFIPHNPKPMIKVKNIDIIGISSSSILHVGNSRNISMEARVKHIRQELPFGHEQDMQ